MRVREEEGDCEKGGCEVVKPIDLGLVQALYLVAVGPGPSDIIASTPAPLDGEMKGLVR